MKTLKDSNQVFPELLDTGAFRLSEQTALDMASRFPFLPVKNK